MRILLADDHTLFKDALIRYIERIDSEMEMIDARDMRDVMAFLENEPVPDLILLDLRMPGMEGFAGLRKVRELYPDVKVALMSGLAEKADVEEALSLGATGYFPKTLSGKEMMKGIHLVLQGELFLPRDHNSNDIMPAYYGRVIEKVKNIGRRVGGGGAMAPEPIQDGSMAESVKLTPREYDVLDCLLRGASNKEIAKDLDIQVVTVKLHVRSLCRKLDAKNRTQAALNAQKMGLKKVG